MNTINELTQVKTQAEAFKIIDDSIQKFKDNDGAYLKYLSLKSKYFSKYKAHDSAIRVAKKQLERATKVQDSFRIIEAFYKIGLYNRRQKNDSEAIHYFELCSENAKSFNNVLYAGKSNTNLGSIYKKKDSLRKSFFHYNLAFSNYKFLNDSSNVAGKLLQMANIQKSIGDFLGSLETAIEGMRYVKVNSDRWIPLGFYQNITTSYRELGDYENALEYNNKALALLNDPSAKKSLSKAYLVICKNTQGNLLADLGKYDEAINLYKEILTDSSLSKKERNRSKDNLGHAIWMQDNRSPEARIVLKEVLNSRIEENDYKGLIASNIHLTKYFFNSQKDTALTYAQNALKYAEKVNSLYGQAEALGYILDLKENASEEAKQYIKIKNRLEKLQQDTRDIYVVTRFQNDQLKEENFSLALTNANQKSNMILSISLFAMFFVISIFSFFFLRAKHQRDKVKTIIGQTLKTETQISQKVHDELANDMAETLHFIDRHPKIPQAAKTLLVNKLDPLYERTRDIATEIASFDLSNFTQSLRYLIIQYHVPGIKVITNIGAGINMDSLPNHKKTNVYRCIQELLINMKKHSDAKEVRVIFKHKNNNFSIQYTDDGKGTDLATIKKRGLQNMESRMDDIGGSVTFKSSIGNGFQATLHFKS